jgi:hypothetical protein
MDDINALYKDVLSASEMADGSKGMKHVCKKLAEYCNCDAVRIGVRGNWYEGNSTAGCPFSKRKTLRLSDDTDVIFEFYFRERNYDQYEAREEDGTLHVVVNLVGGVVLNSLFKRLDSVQAKRTKELRVINMTADLLKKGLEVEISMYEICRFLLEAWESTEQVSVRINYAGQYFTSEHFFESEHRIEASFELPDNRRGYVEVFYNGELMPGREVAFLPQEQELISNIAYLIASTASNHIYKRLDKRTSERIKELNAINRISSILAKDQSLEDTFHLVTNALLHSWQYPESTCVRIVYEDVIYESRDFVESVWSIRDFFVTLDNKKGVIQVFYKEEFPFAFDGPFLKEEVQLLSVISRLICGYVNNYKGRELFNNLPKVASTAVSEDFRKTLTRDKQPLQLFFNKQIIEKYVYLDMMKYKVKNILFVATLYDSFILENDDSFFEQFMGEIYQYSLFSLPRITGVTSPEEALELMESTRFDLAILMVGLDSKTTIKLSGAIKERQADIPVYLLLNQKNDIKKFEEIAAYTPSIDKLFVWNGNSQIFFSIVKSTEDNANVENDTKIGLVRVILLVEDSPEYYSKYLQLLFSIVFNQVQLLLGPEERNEINKISKMRQRPKILHARNYEDAMYIYEKYKDYLLCVISDVEFERNGATDPMAGYSLLKYMLKNKPMLPTILQSADPRNREAAERIGVEFLDKNSDTLEADMMEFLTSRLGFGDFIFRNHKGKRVAQAKGIKEFEIIFRNIPPLLLAEYCKDNRISSWFMSRGEIPLARAVNPIRFDDYSDPEAFRGDILRIMKEYLDNRRRGKVLDFDEVDVPDERNVISMAPGSLGGKGRGLAFINTLIQNIDTSAFDKEINVRMPITAIVGTDEFTRFMERGKLYKVVNSECDYQTLRERFAEVPLSDELTKRLYRFLSQVRQPLAVRSSSLSEDSINQPFAGVFDTYLIPNNSEDIKENLAQVSMAIKMVFASIYSETSRAYFQTIRCNIEAEKMAVVLQVLAGAKHGDYYYPHISGTAQSYNYYPVAHMKPEEGFAVAGFGLGYYVVGGSKAFRFSPVWPNIDIMSTTDIVKNTQVDFLAVDLNRKNIDYLADGEHAPLATLDILEAEKHGTLKHCASVYNLQNDTIEAGLSAYGPRVVNFANILKYGYIPLPGLISLLTETAKEAHGSPIEIEWAVDLNPAENGLPSFYLLQMKPIITDMQGGSVEIDKPKREEAILYTEQSLGNGDIKDITDIIFADPELFDKLHTQEMVKEIEYLNNIMIEKEKNYILIGPGRWGTRDRFIGIPVQWSQISMAKVIVEMSLPNFPLDSSLGSHFFHNVTSMNIGYLSVQSMSDIDYINWDNVRSLEIVNQTKYFKHVRAPRPFSVKMNGKERKSAICFGKPDVEY